MFFIDEQTRLIARGSQTSEQDIKAVELVRNRLHGENSFEQQFSVLPETCRVEEISGRSQVVCQMQEISPNNEGKITSSH